MSNSDVNDTGFPKSVVLDKDKKMEYIRYIDEQVLYYKSVLSSENLLPAKRRQLTKEYNVLQASKKQLLSDSSSSQDTDSILEANEENEVKIPESCIGISEDSPGVKDNTLLKSLPFLGLGKDEEDRITEIVSHPDSFRTPEELDLIKITSLNPGAGPIRARPVLHVISVKISNTKCSDWEEFEIYGQISITDDQKNTFYIYNCEQNDPELISPKFNNLFLYDWTITPVYMGEKVKFNIFRKDGDRKILEGEYNVDYTVEDIDEKISVIKCENNEYGYCASMEFTKIPFACIASVGMFLSDQSGKVGEYGIHGTIKINDIVCFEAQSTEPLLVKHGAQNCFPLHRTMFAIPVYSSLIAQIKLFCGDHVVADDELEAFPCGHTYYSWHICCKDRNYGVLMDVESIRYNNFFDRGELTWVDNVNVKWNIHEDCHQIKKPPVAVNSGCALVEVFSVFVGGGDSTSLALCGTIVVRDRVHEKTAYIFSRNSEFPDVLSNKRNGLRSRLISLAWPSDRWIVEKDFYMDVKLRDTEGTEICRGGLRWWHKQDGLYMERYDKRLCDVLEGENGYFVAVQYSIFSNGKKAKVSVEWKGPDCVVYGSIDAEYMKYGYPSTYHKTYYQNIIFKRCWEDCLIVRSCSEIQLSKSCVSAPSDCQGLNINVHLLVNEAAITEFEHSFEFKAGKTHVEIKDYISVKVEWF